MLWVPVILLLLASLLGLGLLGFFCLRRPIPDPWSETALQALGNTPYAALARRERDWFAARGAVPVTVDADDDIELHALLLPLPERQRKGTVLLFHGYRGSWKEDFVTPGIVRFFYEKGYQVLLPDQRGHGSSGGLFITLGVWERFDVRDWTLYLADRFGPFPSEIGNLFEVVKIRNLGAALGFEKIIVKNGLMIAFFEDLLRYTLAQSDFLPADPTLALLNLTASLVAGFRLDDGSTLRSLRESNYPVLLIHGTGDAAVPVRYARQNFNACASKKELLLVENAGHGQCWLAEPERLRKAVGEFLNVNRRDV